MLRLTRALAAETGAKNLCLAGGVALNCVANGKCCATALRAKSGFSRRPATPAARSARRLRRVIIHEAACRALHGNGRTACRAPISGPPSRKRISSNGLTAAGATFTVLADEAI